MPFHISTAGTSLNNATYVSHKRTVHIPGSHALPPGVSTTMAWELGYAGKRFDADTRGMENTVHRDMYHLREQGEPWRELEEAKLKHDEALLLAQELGDAVRTVKREEKEKAVEVPGGVSGDVKNLDQLNPYFMHLELLKKKYAPDQLITWSNSGRKGYVPVGGWPSDVQFEMGVKYMPEIAEAVFVMNPAHHPDQAPKKPSSGTSSIGIRQVVPGETKSEQLLREILQIQNEKSLAVEEEARATPEQEFGDLEEEDEQPREYEQDQELGAWIHQ
ncbi:UNVERIFIED_CONTAM: hypothetical protein HDU68_003561, partial [Siphonaria sp. JEL0065]